MQVDRPCKTCGHRWDEHYEPIQTRYGYSSDNSKCRVVTYKITGLYSPKESYFAECKCYIYEGMTNLEYLEYLYDKKQIKSSL